MSDRVQAQESAAAAAEAVVRRAFDQHDAMRWPEVAALLHPEALARFRASELDRARMGERMQREPRVRPRDPDMPPEVAAWLEEQDTRMREQYASSPPQTFGDVLSAEQLEALSAEEMLVRHLRSTDSRTRVLQQLRAQGREELTEADVRDLAHGRREVLGSVLEDASTVQVLYRTSFMGPDTDPGRLSVATVRNTPAGWRIWTTWDDAWLSDSQNMFIFVPTEEEVEKRLRQAAEKVATWQSDGVGEGRAFVTGYPGGTEPPQALVIEVPQRDGTTARVEIPFSAFPSLLELLYPWPAARENR